MIKMTPAQIASALNITTVPNDAAFQGICIDSRRVAPHQLFVALQGEHVDGHDFIEAARAKGAAAALVTRKTDSPLPQIMVRDNILALGTLSAAWRHPFTLPIVAVTGSNGKTTLKNMIASIMKAACQGDDTPVLATQGNLNNHLGLPLTLARLNAQHRYAVIEMGMNHFGEIEYLTRLTRPKVAVITNAAAAHLEGVCDLAGVARAKAEIFTGLSEDGMAVLNRDDAAYPYWRTQIGQHPCLTFGFHPEADVTATPNPDNLHPILLRTPKGNMEIQLPLLGTHNLLNTLAAAAAALAVGIDLPAIKQGIETIQPAPGRMQMHTLQNGVKIIDDTYNANPFSLAAAIDTLASFNGKKIMVLGDMKELGSEAKQLHQTAAKHMRQAGIDFLFTFGELSANTSHSFGDGSYHFSEQEKLVSALLPLLCNQTTILVKGSRSMQMDKVVSRLVQ
ncbi:MAG: hypothetical protein A3E85_01590 [Gammaproteobacteria bacterium RIFCSPHIGHO2_12_FULL_45_12]|nr:MAG: hypothetical protein A3E85_01590 [Gammaproteobacteria bacterium RIFCSPHIGHO2_12_FULL_45_12]